MLYMQNLLAKIEEKKKQLDAHQPFELNLTKNLQEWFKIELTYTSNAIEGNTLSRAETALVVEKDLTIGGKTLNEHLEAINHAAAFELVMDLVTKAKTDLTENTILDLHRLILQKIDDNNAGRYRSVLVRIAGSSVIMPNPLKVPQLMAEFIIWLNKQRIDEMNLVTLAAEAHLKLVSIHPFVDSNGRTARLLMNLILMQAGHPPVIILKEERERYIDAIEKTQLGGSRADYLNLIYTAVERSCDIYLSALENREQEKTLSQKELLKIGELAKLTNESVATIRHWTKAGLIEVKAYSEGGYQLYEQKQVKTIEQIRQLQNQKRLTLTEIEQILKR